MGSCKECGENLVGRVDKLFCSDECRSAYHNKIHREESKSFKRINGILKKNYRILLSCLSSGEAHSTYSSLSEKGYNFRYHTSHRVISRRKVELTCYDITILLKSNKVLYIKGE